jgi:hypothetical protein
MVNDDGRFNWRRLCRVPVCFRLVNQGFFPRTIRKN